LAYSKGLFHLLQGERRRVAIGGFCVEATEKVGESVWSIQREISPVLEKQTDTFALDLK
jgi:hypothetical protein